MIKAAAMATAEVADELTLIDFLDQNPNPQKPPQKLLEELLDSSVDTFSGLSPAKNSSLDGGGELNEEEEELEWLSNKDAFPSLETSFEIPSTSTSPVSVLAPPPLFKVPVKKRSKIHQKKRRDFPRIAREASRGRRRCRHCEAEETPQWRMGPDGPKTLCNACGVRFKKGRLFPEYRPANSPTFSAEIHSNSTRKILEMRTGTARTAARRGRPKPVVM